jgi:Tfp pilus assembly protein PilF
MTRRTASLLLLIAAGLALGACARSLSVGPLRAGVAAANDERWDEAVRYWKQALQLDPKSAAAHNNLAVAYEKLGDWPAAAKEYEEAMRLDPKNAQIRGNYEAFQGRLDAARGKRP